MLKTLKDYKEHIFKLKNDPEYRKSFEEKRDALIRKEWLDLEKFSTPLDIPHIPVVDKKQLEDFYHPILIKCGAIPKSDLIDGEWYYGSFRNNDVAKWNVEKQEFDYVNFSFIFYWDRCEHFQDDRGYAVFVPIRKATESEIEEELKNIATNPNLS